MKYMRATTAAWCTLGGGATASTSPMPSQPTGGTTLRLGYRGRIETSWVNHINTHIFTHALVIGIGGELLSLRHGKKPRGAVVSPQY